MVASYLVVCDVILMSWLRHDRVLGAEPLYCVMVGLRG
jgi:hypothetical protein